MYSINLKDLPGSTPLPDQVFTAEFRYEVVTQAIEYLTVNHPDHFPNPVTAERKISEIVKNADGLTLDEEVELEQSKSAQDFKELFDKQTALIIPIEEKYKVLREREYESHTNEFTVLSDEMYNADSEAAKETIQLKIDGSAHQYNLAIEALYRQEEAEILVVREHIRSTLDVE